MIAGIIMVSGFSNRMKEDKLLLKIGGKSLIERVVEVSTKSKLDEVVLIYRKKEVKDMGMKYGLKVIENEKAEKGQSESIKLGIKNVSNNINGYMFIVGDQPFLDSDTIDKLISEFNKNSQSIIIPLYDGKSGNPVIFPKSLKDELLSLEGDVGGKHIVEKNKELVKKIYIENKLAGLDMDTREEYEKLKGEVKND